jgi:peptidoglycan/LPS O-acetylase OafA/YrhL
MMSAAAAGHRNRLDVLDGWRGISIALVMWGHLLPAGPRGSGMNEAVAGTGMAIFFILSGFLITTGLQRDPRVVPFIVRRLARILPLAWLAMSVMLAWQAVSDPAVWWRHLAFLANTQPITLTEYTSHFWSLCVEVQFYAGVALLVALGGRRALWILPLIALAITALRIHDQRLMAIDTQYRVDEILAGGILALLYGRYREAWPKVAASAVPVLLVLLMASAHPATGALNYVRPYLALLMVAASLGMAPTGVVARMLYSAALAYLARVSYALYVLHGGLRWTWLGTGDTTMVKYLKRPLLFAVTFCLSHWSTFHMESHFNQWARRWAMQKAP